VPRLSIPSDPISDWAGWAKIKECAKAAAKDHPLWGTGHPVQGGREGCHGNRRYFICPRLGFSDRFAQFIQIKQSFFQQAPMEIHWSKLSQAL